MAILEKTQQQIRDEAQQQDDLDLVYEKTAVRKLNALVKTIVYDFSILYATTGNIVNVTQYADELKTILNQTYRRVNTEFSTSLKNNLEEALAQAKTEEEKERIQKLIDLRDKIGDDIAVVLLAWTRLQATSQSAHIINTWQNIIRKRVDDSVSENLSEGLSTDNQTIAKKTKNPLQAELVTHNETIGMQEVQTATENAKFVEADEYQEELTAAAVVVAAREILEKEWVTMGDDRVRPAHEAANGQRRNLRDPYLVGGELLRYPKDTSLGASLGNVIRCRCKSIIF